MLNQVNLQSTLKTIPWFLELSPESMRRLAALAEVRLFEPGEIVYSEGEQHPYTYIILEGKVCLESYVPGRGILPILTLESLDVVGWSSMTPVVRQKNSTARVVEKTKLLAFHADTLMNLCKTDCELGFVIMKRLANIVASHMINHRLRLLELLTNQNG